MSRTYEHVIAMPSEAAAIADPILSRWYDEGWDRSCVLTGLRCWDSREDTEQTIGEGEVNTVHALRSAGSFWMCIGLTEINEDLRAHPGLKLLADHHAREIDKAPVETWVIQSAVPLEDIPYFHVEP